MTSCSRASACPKVGSIKDKANIHPFVNEFISTLGGARLQSGALEGSNVSPVATMVGMIAAARQFEHQMKMLENAEKQDQQASKLLSEN